MASSPVFVPCEEYLQTSYYPDRDWINGETKQRNLREQPHANVQSYLTRVLGNHAAEWKIHVFLELRVQTSANNYRIPDDPMSDIQERVEDYLAKGVPAVWVVDPRLRRAYAAISTGALEPALAELTIAGTEIRIPIPDIFAELDELEANS